MPFGMGPMELFFILLILLVVFGAGRLPEIGRSMGRAITEFKRGVTAETEERPAPLPERDPTGQPKA